MNFNIQLNSLKLNYNFTPYSSKPKTLLCNP